LADADFVVAAAESDLDVVAEDGIGPAVDGDQVVAAAGFEGDDAADGDGVVAGFDADGVDGDAVGASAGLDEHAVGDGDAVVEVDDVVGVASALDVQVVADG